MFILKIAISVIFWSVLQLTVLFLYLLSFPAALLFKFRSGFMYLITRIALRIIFFIFFVRVNVEGKKNLIRGEGAICFANHPGAIDPLYLIAALPVRFQYVAQASLFKIFLLGRVIKAIGCIPAPEGKSDYLRFGRELKMALDRGSKVLIFPEQPRKGIEILASFKPGTFEIARSLDKPLIPLVIKGSEVSLPKGGLIFSPARIRVLVDLPTEKGANLEQVEARFRQSYEKL